jgi:hypothetical protein
VEEEVLGTTLITISVNKDKMVVMLVAIVRYGVETEAQDKHRVTADILAVPLDIMVMDHILLAEEEVQQGTVTVAAAHGRPAAAALDYYLRLTALVFIGVAEVADLAGLIPPVQAEQVEVVAVQQAQAVQQDQAGLA